MPDVEKEMLCCSFCGKGQGEVDKLIFATTACICNKCVELALDILSEDEEFLPCFVRVSIDKNNAVFSKGDLRYELDLSASDGVLKEFKGFLMTTTNVVKK